MPDFPIEFVGAFGILLKHARKSRRQTQLTVAVELRVDHSVISRWESGSEYPKPGQLDSIRVLLSLPEAEFDNLYFAWKRETSAMVAQILDRASRPAEIIEFTRKSVTLAREMRKAGQPRLAMVLCERDQKVIFNRIREQTWSRAHPEMLACLAELMVEQCKAKLDFLPRNDVRNGALHEVLARLRMISETCRTDITQFYSDLATEGVTYVGGDVRSAFAQTHDLIANQVRLPSAWRAEVLRAGAINAGKVRDRDVLKDVDTQIAIFLDEMDVFIRDGEDAFLLEGLARGWASLDPERASMIMERAWAARERTKGPERASQLRYVQLVRSEAEIAKEDLLGVDRAALRKKVEDAILISSGQGYDRYVNQLDRLLADLSGESAESEPTS